MEGYLKKLFKLDTFLLNLERLMKENIDINNSRHYYIINKDLISRHINTELFDKIHSFNLHNNIDLNKNTDELVNLFMNNVDIKNDKIVENKDINSTFFNPETLKILLYEYYNNFFIIEQDIFEDIFDFPPNGINKHKTFIGKEGIFILKTFKFNDESKICIYFIKSMDELKLDNFRLNKLYIFNNEKNFLDEFNNHMKGKKAESYFASRNFFNGGGILNLMNDGKKIGLYININRIENYAENENDTDENREYINKFLQ